MDKNTNNEIDVVNLLKDLIQKIKVNRKRTFLIFSLPILASLAFYFLWPKQYELILVGSSKYIRSEALTEIGGALNIAAREKNANLLASTLKIETSLAKNIIKIKLNSIRPDILAQSTAPQKESYFQLVITVSSSNQKDLLQAAFMNYLENNPNVVERKRLSQQMDKKMIEKISFEITNLEEFRKQLLAGKYSDPKFIMMDPSKINQTIVDLNYQVAQLESNIESKTEFSLIQGFITPEKPSFPQLGITILTGVMIGLSLAFCFVLISD
jgi:hypothetical protein